MWERRFGSAVLVLFGALFLTMNGCVAALIKETTFRQYGHVDDQDENPGRLNVDLSQLPPGSVEITEKKTRHGTAQKVTLKHGMQVRIVVLPATRPSRS
jgi:hypothetical protein